MMCLEYKYLSSSTTNEDRYDRRASKNIIVSDVTRTSRIIWDLIALVLRIHLHL
jgi:hypothetical protein